MRSSKRYTGRKNSFEFKNLGGQKFGKRCLPRILLLDSPPGVGTLQQLGNSSEQSGRKHTWLTLFNLACPQNAIFVPLSVCFDMFVL